MAGLDRTDYGWSREVEFLLVWIRRVILFLNRFLPKWPRLRLRCLSSHGVYFEYGMVCIGDIKSSWRRIVCADGISRLRSGDSLFYLRIHRVFQSLLPSLSVFSLKVAKTVNCVEDFSMYNQGSYISRLQYENSYGDCDNRARKPCPWSYTKYTVWT